MQLAAAAGAGSLLAGPLARPLFAAETAEYDDGSDAVPDGAAGDPERVIIVGAGWAGLTLANALRNAGVELRPPGGALAHRRPRAHRRRRRRADRSRLLVDPRAGRQPADAVRRAVRRGAPQRRHRARRCDDPRVRRVRGPRGDPAREARRVRPRGQLRRQRGVEHLRRARPGRVRVRRRAGLPRPPGPSGRCPPAGRVRDPPDRRERRQLRVGADLTRLLGELRVAVHGRRPGRVPGRRLRAADRGDGGRHAGAPAPPRAMPSSGTAAASWCTARRAGSGGGSTARTSSSPCRSACSRPARSRSTRSSRSASGARSGGSGSGRSRRSRWCSTSRSGATRRTRTCSSCPTTRRSSCRSGST